MSIDRCVLGGFSRGVSIVLRAALRAPERCTPEPGMGHVRRWATNILSRATEAAAERIATMQPEAPIDWEQALRALRLPTLVIHGEHDVLARTPTMRHLASLIPDCRFVVMEGSGHLPAMTRPHDVAREIDAFMRTLPARAPAPASSNASTRT